MLPFTLQKQKLKLDIISEMLKDTRVFYLVLPHGFCVRWMGTVCLLATAPFLSLIWRAHFVCTVENCYPFFSAFPLPLLPLDALPRDALPTRFRQRCGDCSGELVLPRHGVLAKVFYRIPVVLWPLFFPCLLLLCSCVCWIPFRHVE